ncbi:helix-turn-helix transcriptional regulator [Paenibacillus alvei]|uniref:helix-turn-helix domain-containing protein n=1 Tax=Paenibacillus alvei TaxID=44250 RepID=UPI00227F391B|nr:helix-turn-helix transcriptional regulator [Paenibacillus alvei]MCY9737940.1 helix-turn-helix transcriptional regulator [Paenibacillus alvei]
MINKKTLGVAIKKKRKDRKLTQYELSVKIGLSRNYISDLETGRYMPSVEALASIAWHLNLDLNLLKMPEIQVIRKGDIC